MLPATGFYLSGISPVTDKILSAPTSIHQWFTKIFDCAVSGNAIDEPPPLAR
jgi:hypothetical protein